MGSSLQCDLCGEVIPPQMYLSHLLEDHRKESAKIVGNTIAGDCEWHHRLFMELYPTSAPSVLAIDHAAVEHYWNLATIEDRIDMCTVHYSDVFELFLRSSPISSQSKVRG